MQRYYKVGTKMNSLLILLVAFIRSYGVAGVKIIWDNSVDYNFNDFDISSRADEVRMPNRFFIYPGTKWCGAGNIAESDDDFGIHRDTDKCCRNHDYCPDIIEGFQTRYNLTNPSFYTRLNCKCDRDFYQCLKTVKSATSGQVGNLYFTALGTQCYKNEFPVTGCDKYSYFPRKKCLNYTFDRTKEKEYQWFDLPNF
ncbi:phospholipase A2-like [Anoplophora glabripennis]|uniref:phospholipase A2-like n=1 Tax=Anoplophora glabripennis TaxID=217634 RepID=UPI0008740A89|nr:phospholipase A2-like [Anoplophora glabripennis]